MLIEQLIDGKAAGLVASDQTIPSAKAGGKPAHTPHGKAQRQALILAAYHLIAEKGFEQLRTRDVAARAGVNIATLHYYFASKEDLVRGVADYLSWQFREVHDPSLLEVSPTPIEYLRQELWDTNYLMRQFPETYIVMYELVMHGLRDPATNAVLREMDSHWHEHIKEVFALGVKQGVFRADLDPDAAASFLTIFIKGCIAQLFYSPEMFPAERVYAEIERWMTSAPPGAER